MAKGDISEIKSCINDILNTLVAFKTESQKKFEKIEKQADKIDDFKDTVHKDIYAIQNNINNIQTSILNISQDFKTYQSSSLSTEKKIFSIEATVTKHTSAMKQLDKNYQSIFSNISQCSYCSRPKQSMKSDEYPGLDDHKKLDDTFQQYIY